MKNKQIIATKTKKIKIKPWMIIVGIFILILTAIAAFFTAANIVKNYNLEQNITQTTETKWNSDAKLVDDRLDEGYPIMYIVSPFSSDGIQYGTALCLYNDGTFISEIITFDSYDDFYNELNTNAAFWEHIKEGYNNFKDTEGMQLVTENQKPSEIRETYLKQYEVENFSLETQIDMSSNNNNTFYIYGITYDDDKKPTSHLYYSQSSNSKSIISSDEGEDVLTGFTNISSSDVLNELEN